MAVLVMLLVLIVVVVLPVTILVLLLLLLALTLRQPPVRTLPAAELLCHRRHGLELVTFAL